MSKHNLLNKQAWHAFLALAFIMLNSFAVVASDDQLQHNLLGDDQLMQAGLGDDQFGILDGFVSAAGTITNLTNITISKLEDIDPVPHSGFLNYTIAVNVTGNGTAFNVTVNDTYPNQTIFLNSQPANLTGTNNTWILGNLTAGTNYRINISLLVTNVTNNLTINNSVNVSFQNETSQGFQSRNTTISTAVFIPLVFNVTTISVTKTDTPDPVNASQFLNYTILVNVTGNGTAYNVTVNDTYPNQTIYLTSSPAPLTGTNNTWILGNLTSGASISINISMLVNNVTNSLTINNSVNVSFQNETSQGFNSVNISINTSVNNFTTALVNISNLSLTKTDSVDPAIISTLFNYTINVTSNGQDIASNVTVNDTYPNEVIFQSAQPSPLTGTNNTWILGNLSPGTSVLINITVMLNNISSGAVLNNTVNATFQNASGTMLSIVRTETTIAQGEITGCPVVINTTTRLAQFLRTNTSCIIINASNIEFDCDNYRIIGNRTDFGIGINITGKENVTVRNCFVENFTTSLILEHTNKSTIINQTCFNNYSAYSSNIWLIRSSNNTIYARPRSNGAWLYSDENSTDNNLTNTTFDTLNGSIRFHNTLQIKGMQNVSTAGFNITPNKALVNSIQLPFLNASAEITLNGITLVDPTPTVDYEDDGTFVPCPASICTETGYANGIFSFNVTHFTSFSSTAGNANVTLTKTDSADPVPNGDLLMYTINISNNGTSNATNINLTEIYPPQAIFNATTGTLVEGTNDTFLIGNISPRTSVQFTITVRVNTPALNLTLMDNTINISYTNDTGILTTLNVTESTTITPTTPLSGGSVGRGGGGVTAPSAPQNATPTPAAQQSTQPIINQTLEELPAGTPVQSNAIEEQPAIVPQPIRTSLPEIAPKPRTFWTPTHAWLSIAALLAVLLLALFIISSQTSTARRRPELFSSSMSWQARVTNVLRTILDIITGTMRVLLFIFTVLALMLNKHVLQFLKQTICKLAGQLKRFITGILHYFKEQPRTTTPPAPKQQPVRPTKAATTQQPTAVCDDITRLQRLGFKIKGVLPAKPALPVAKDTVVKPTPVVKPTLPVKDAITKPMPAAEPIKRKTVPDETLSKLIKDIEQPLDSVEKPTRVPEQPVEKSEHEPEPVTEHIPGRIETPAYPEPRVIHHGEEPQRAKPEKIEPFGEEAPMSEPKATETSKADAFDGPSKSRSDFEEKLITPTMHAQDRKTMLEQLKETYDTGKKAVHKKTSAKKMLDELKEVYRG